MAQIEAVAGIARDDIAPAGRAVSDRQRLARSLNAIDAIGHSGQPRPVGTDVVAVELPQPVGDENTLARIAGNDVAAPGRVADLDRGAIARIDQRQAAGRVGDITHPVDADTDEVAPDAAIAKTVPEIQARSCIATEDIGPGKRAVTGNAIICTGKAQPVSAIPERCRSGGIHPEMRA